MKVLCKYCDTASRGPLNLYGYNAFYCVKCNYWQLFINYADGIAFQVYTYHDESTNINYYCQKQYRKNQEAINHIYKINSEFMSEFEFQKSWNLDPYVVSFLGKTSIDITPSNIKRIPTILNFS